MNIHEAVLQPAGACATNSAHGRGFAKNYFMMEPRVK